MRAGLGAARLASAFVIVLATVVPTWAEATGGPTAAMDGQWHFVVAPYFWFSGLKGDVSVKGLPDVPVDKSFSDIWSDFHFGALGHFEGRKDRLGFVSDLMYLDLHAPVAAGAPVLGQLGLSATVKALTVEGLGFYRVATGGRKDNPGHLDVLVGVRYYGMSSQLNGTVPNGTELAGDKKTLDWADALAGLRFRAPLGSRMALVGRGDVAGFGSKFTWNLEGDLAVRASEHWSLGAGWRHMDIDYDKGSGTDRKLFNVAYDGPRAWFAYAW
jgi:hypothetical protein